MAFKVNQQVKYRGMEMPATVLSGPHASPGADRYLIRKADGNVSLVNAKDLAAIDDRQERVAATLYGVMGGMRSWETVYPSVRALYLRAANEVLTELGKANEVLPELGKAKDRPLAVGDRIRILRHGLEFATVSVGDILTVECVDIGRFRTNAPGRPSITRWTFNLSSEGTGWERV